MVEGKGPAPRTGPDRPLVAACLAPEDLRPDVDPLTGEVVADPRRADLTAADAAALELALRAGERWGVAVLAVAAGPPWVEPVLRTAAAAGAEVLRVAGGPDGIADGLPAPLDAAALAGDPAATAAALSAALIGAGRPLAVFCGDRTAGGGTGAVPAFLAQRLGAAQALGLVAVELAADAVLAERRLDGGWRERLRVPQPAVCSVEGAVVRLRRAPLAAALAAARAPVPVIGAGSVDIGGPAVRMVAPQPYRPRTRRVPAPAGGTHQRLLALTGALAEHDPPRLIGPIGADAAVGELRDYLERHGYAG